MGVIGTCCIIGIQPLEESHHFPDRVRARAQIQKILGEATSAQVQDDCGTTVIRTADQAADPLHYLAGSGSGHGMLPTLTVMDIEVPDETVQPR